MKTAKQHNASLVGESEFIPVTSLTERPRIMADTIPTGTPWSLRDIKGTVTDVIEQVEAATFVPAEDKVCLVAKIRKLPPMKLIRLDVHENYFNTQRGPYLNFTGTISAI